jgi:hypothetical protein
VIIANLITLLLAAWILGLKLVLQRRQRPDQNRKFKPIE